MSGDEAQRPPPAASAVAGRREWSEASERWFARLLAAAPPLSEWQRERLRVLLAPEEEES